MSLDDTTERVLDNMTWHALTGPHGPYAEGDGRALRYRRSMAVFCATERLDDTGWSALTELVGPGRAVVLFQPDIGAVPDGLDELFRTSTWQMVADRPLTARPVRGESVEIVELGTEDVEEMMALTSLTEPGPFFAETHRLGTYLGVRDGGRLIAMAGERLRTEGVAEISAVCTHPDARRRGLGGLLTTAMVDVIRDRGQLAMLHVAKSNAPAIPLYEALGFRIRREVEAVGARVHADKPEGNRKRDRAGGATDR